MIKWDIGGDTEEEDGYVANRGAPSDIVTQMNTASGPVRAAKSNMGTAQHFGTFMCSPVYFAPIANDTAILSAVDVSAATGKTIFTKHERTSFDADWAIPRVLEVSLAGTSFVGLDQRIEIRGCDWYGNSISEIIDLDDPPDDDNPGYTVKAFACSYRRENTSGPNQSAVRILKNFSIRVMDNTDYPANAKLTVNLTEYMGLPCAMATAFDFALGSFMVAKNLSGGETFEPLASDTIYGESADHVGIEMRNVADVDDGNIIYNGPLENFSFTVSDEDYYPNGLNTYALKIFGDLSYVDPNKLGSSGKNLGSSPQTQK